MKARVNCCLEGPVLNSDPEELENLGETKKHNAQRHVRKKRKKSLSETAINRAKVKLEVPDSNVEDMIVESEAPAAVDVSQYLSVEHNIKKEKEETAAAHFLAAIDERKPSLASEQTQPTTETSDNLDYNLTITKSTRGHEQLLYDGYTYLRLPHQGSGSSVVRWKCTSYYAAKTGCRARLNTTVDGLSVLLDSKTGEHNHPTPGQKTIKTILFREQVG